MRDYEHGIEVTRKNGNGPFLRYGSGVRLAFQADFILDLTTFKASKHRYGSAGDLTPTEAAEWLTFYLDQPNMRVLLLTD